MNTKRNIALAIALVGVVSVSEAAVRTNQVRPNNWNATAAPTFVPLNASGATVINFTLPAAGNKILTYSAECSVDAPAGNSASWADIDILVNGVVVKPTGGSSDAFCSANGTAGFDGWQRTSITVMIKGLKGNNSVMIQSRGNFGATGVWLGDTALVVHD